MKFYKVLDKDTSELIDFGFIKDGDQILTKHVIIFIDETEYDALKKSK